MTCPFRLLYGSEYPPSEINITPYGDRSQINYFSPGRQGCMSSGGGWEAAFAPLWFSHHTKNNMALNVLPVAEPWLWGVGDYGMGSQGWVEGSAAT